MTSRRITDSDGGGGGGSKEDPRLHRIRENQRRSRARRREYLEDLEARWKRCQEMGVQADVELQRAARKVIEENNVLRTILAELGVGKEEIERRLAASRAAGTGGAAAAENLPGQFDLQLQDARAVGGGDLMDDLDLTQLDFGTSPPFGGGYGASSSGGGSVQGNEAPPPPPAPVPVPALDEDLANLNFLEQQDIDNMFDISQFIEPLDLAPPLPLASDTVATAEGSTSQAFTTVDTATTSTACCPRGNSNTTPCTEVYTLLKALNAQRQEHKDMFEIVLELWNGFCYPEEGGGSGCRVDNEVLRRVIDGMMLGAGRGVGNVGEGSGAGSVGEGRGEGRGTGGIGEQ